MGCQEVHYISLHHPTQKLPLLQLPIVMISKINTGAHADPSGYQGDDFPEAPEKVESFYKVPKNK